MLLLHGSLNELHEIVFDEITKDLIQRATIRIKGATDLSKFDNDNWQRILGSTVFGNHSSELRKSLARMTKKLCYQKLSCLESLKVLLASHLITLSESSGVRPIGIGELLQRMISEAVMSVVKKEVAQTTDSLQVCAGQIAGVE